MAGMSLSPEQIQRYSRHLTLPQVGIDGQQRLGAASVLLVGAGGLGCPLAIYLAAAGLGRIGIVDFDVVDASNLQRQILFSNDDIGRPKVECAAQRIRAINPHVVVEPHQVRFGVDNAFALLDAYDIVVDGTDNFQTRYLVNDASILRGKPNVYGSIFRFEGQVSVFGLDAGPCYRCLYPEPPAPGAVPSCAEGGVLGILPGIIGTLQATETIKLVLQRGESLGGRLLLFDALEMRFRELTLRRDPACPVCGDRPTITELAIAETGCELPTEPVNEIEPRELAQKMTTAPAPRLLDVRSVEEWAIAHLEGALHIPLGELSQRVGELDPGGPLVVYCKIGARGARAVRTLLEHGFTRVQNLKGGLDRWSVEIDPTLPRY
jgi:molybdopterin/thiamine biosynthesis adenylyltransferase/rhodanese-related sulfurtransferase